MSLILIPSVEKKDVLLIHTDEFCCGLISNLVNSMSGLSHVEIYLCTLIIVDQWKLTDDVSDNKILGNLHITITFNLKTTKR